MEIKILGTGCASCKNLEKATREAVEEMNINANVVKEEDIMNIMAYGVMRAPGLVINEKVVLSGRVPSQNELKELLEKNK
ncbi:MAG: thioredoxin family protein [Bacteroidetes bacterium]|nr:MAG: thioredoxin family protein [Bacteroidota bacterium]